MSRYSQGVFARKLVNRTLASLAISAAFGHDVVGHGLQRFEPGVAAIFDHDLEAAGRCQAFQRRCAEHVDHAVGDFALQSPLQLCGNRVARQLRRRALVKIVEHDVHRAESSAHWRPAESTGPGLPRCARTPGVVWWAMFFDLPHHFFGAADRRRIGQLQVDEQIALVLRRNETLGRRRRSRSSVRYSSPP